MSETTRLAFLSGSLRKESSNKKLAHLCRRIAEANGIEAEYIDLNDYALPIYDGDIEAEHGVPENAKKLAEKLATFDGVFIASPEYNGGLSGALKNTIDWMSRIPDVAGTGQNVFKNVVFAIGSSAAGEAGGIRGLISLRQVLAVALGAMVVGGQIQIVGASKAFDDDGNLKDEKRLPFVRAIVEQLAKTAAALSLPR